MEQAIYQVIAHYRAKPENAEEVARNLVELAGESRKEAGNLSYVVTRSLEDSDHFVIVESYGSPAGFEAHRNSEHFQRIGLERIVPSLADRSVQAFSGDGQLS